MKRVFKYQFRDFTQRESFTMPRGADFRAVQIQNNNVCLWFEVEDSRPTEQRTFEIFGTGHELPEGVLWYCGTFQLLNGAFVGHVYEIR